MDKLHCTVLSPYTGSDPYHIGSLFRINTFLWWTSLNSILEFTFRIIVISDCEVPQMKGKYHKHNQYVPPCPVCRLYLLCHLADMNWKYLSKLVSANWYFWRKYLGKLVSANWYFGENIWANWFQQIGIFGENIWANWFQQVGTFGENVWAN